MTPNLRAAPAGTVLLTATALAAFAGNSLLCRVALRSGAIDPAGFTAVRIAAGAVMLWMLIRLGRRGAATVAGGSWKAAAWLLAYAAAFSFAYAALDAGAGALILFGFVQITLMTAGIRRGERFSPIQWTGFGIAFAGLLYLVAPGLHAPPLRAAGLMAAAGVAWGFYTLEGRGVTNPLASTSGNFARAVPAALALAAAFGPSLRFSVAGVAWAALSGAVTSGAGYAVWYAALRHLPAMRASLAQLLVPALAGLGGVLLLGEAATPRLLVSALATLGGVALALRPASAAR